MARGGAQRAQIAGNSEIQKELRTARWLASAAGLLALLAVGLLALVARRTLLAPPRHEAQVNFGDAMGLSAVPFMQGSRGVRGWYRTYLDGLVRDGIAMDSEQVQVLPVGSLVYVAEAQGRRVRILRPVRGWMSLKTSDGVEILRPDMTYTAGLNSTDIEKVFRSREVRVAHVRLQVAAAKLTALEAKLLSTLKDMNERGIAKKAGQKAQEVGRDVPKLGMLAFQGAERAFGKVVQPKGAELLQHILRSPGVDDLVDRARTPPAAVSERGQQLAGDLQHVMGV